MSLCTPTSDESFLTPTEIDRRCRLGNDNESEHFQWLKVTECVPQVPLLNEEDSFCTHDLKRTFLHQRSTATEDITDFGEQTFLVPFTPGQLLLTSRRRWLPDTTYLRKEDRERSILPIFA